MNRLLSLFSCFLLVAFLCGTGVSQESEKPGAKSKPNAGQDKNQGRRGQGGMRGGGKQGGGKRGGGQRGGGKGGGQRGGGQRGGVDTSLSIGEMAPDFTLKSLDGKTETQLSSFKAKKPVVLIFGSYS